MDTTITEARIIIDPYTKLIDCPGDCGGQATLYLYGSPYAGVWECEDCGSDTCLHTNYHMEETVDIHLDIYGFPHERTSTINICDDCNNQVNVEEYDYAS